jgi:hypothetical protein
MLTSKSKLTLYLDTTIPSYVFATDAPERMEITKRFTAMALEPECEMLISDVVLREISRTAEPKKQWLLDVVCKFSVLLSTAESEDLAETYIREGILPRGSIEDARHVAIATLNHVDALVSWNFGHLVNVRRSKAIAAVNARRGKPHIEIVSPQEVIE